MHTGLKKARDVIPQMVYTFYYKYDLKVQGHDSTNSVSGHRQDKYADRAHQ